MTVAVAVFAAGRGSRLGGDASKPLLAWQGRPLLAWALDAAIASGLAPLLVTVGYRSPSYTTRRTFASRAIDRESPLRRLDWVLLLAAASGG